MIGIVGQGFVGSAVREGLKHAHSLATYDLDRSKCTVDELRELVIQCDVIFVCVPTPMSTGSPSDAHVFTPSQDNAAVVGGFGTCDTSIVESVLCQITLPRTVIIKSTVPPGSTEAWNARFRHLSICFNPEFLTEANAKEDFKNQTRIILGGPRKATNIAKQIYSKAFPKTPIIKTHSTIAELVKYTTNTFLMTKVLFANEMYQLCTVLDHDWDKVIEYAKTDPRLGETHWAVPGPDGHFGAGGSCFPKDICALIARARELGLEMPLLSAVWKKNLEVRPEQDWMHLKGRAVR